MCFSCRSLELIVVVASTVFAVWKQPFFGSLCYQQCRHYSQAKRLCALGRFFYTQIRIRWIALDYAVKIMEQLEFGENSGILQILISSVIPFPDRLFPTHWSGMVNILQHSGMWKMFCSAWTCCFFKKNILSKQKCRPTFQLIELFWFILPWRIFANLALPHGCGDLHCICGKTANIIWRPFTDHVFVNDMAQFNQSYELCIC